VLELKTIYPQLQHLVKVVVKNAASNAGSLKNVNQSFLTNIKEEFIMMTKEQKAELMQAIHREGDEKYNKWFVNQTLSTFKLRDHLFTIDKKPIQTKFCYGYSDSRYDTEDFGRANNAAARARHDTMYFTRQNHQTEYAVNIRKLNDPRFKAYAHKHYCTNDILYCVSYCYAWEEIPDRFPEAFELTAEEKTAYKMELVKAIKEHHKKIVAYLKRYGLTKVDSWSYWRDA
jgi:hypothetical protein